MNTLIICLTVIASIAIICYTLYKVLDTVIVNKETTNEMVSDFETIYRLCNDIPDDNIYSGSKAAMKHIFGITTKYVYYDEGGVESAEES